MQKPTNPYRNRTCKTCGQPSRGRQCKTCQCSHINSKPSRWYREKRKKQRDHWELEIDFEDIIKKGDTIEIDTKKM